MFVTNDDYCSIVGEKALTILQQSSAQTRQDAEKFAIEEVSGYLRGRYDAAAAFAATGESRNDLLIMLVCDIALFHLVSSQPNRMGYEIRETRYNNAVKHLKEIQAGTLVLNLDSPTDEDGNEITATSYGCEKKRNNNW